MKGRNLFHRKETARLSRGWLSVPQGNAAVILPLISGEHSPGQEIMFDEVNKESDNNADGSF